MSTDTQAYLLLLIAWLIMTVGWYSDTQAHLLLLIALLIMTVVWYEYRYHYLPSNQENYNSLGICTHAINLLSLPTKKSGEVDEPGYCYSCRHPSVIIYQAIRRSRWVLVYSSFHKTVDEPGYCYSCHHLTVIIYQAIRRCRLALVSVLKLSP